MYWIALDQTNHPIGTINQLFGQLTGHSRTTDSQTIQLRAAEQLYRTKTKFLCPALSRGTRLWAVFLIIEQFFAQHWQTKPCSKIRAICRYHPICMPADALIMNQTSILIIIYKQIPQFLWISGRNLGDEEMSAWSTRTVRSNSKAPNTRNSRAMFKKVASLGVAPCGR